MPSSKFLQSRLQVWAKLSGMDNERIREICMRLPHVAETLNWGHHLVYWAGNREIGGKMFAMTDLDGTGSGVLLFHCGAERYYELIENEGIVPAPHLARAYWVMLEHWDALRPREIEEELRRAHQLILEKLPKRTQAVLALPEGDRKKLVRGRKKVLSGRATPQSTAEPKAKVQHSRSPGVKKSPVKKATGKSSPANRR